MAENTIPTTATTTTTATAPVVSEKTILSTEDVAGFPGVKKNMSTAIESKGKPEQSSGPFEWYQFPRDMSLAELERFFATVIQPGKTTVIASPSSFIIDTVEGALKTNYMNRKRTALKRERIGGKPELDPAIQAQLEKLSEMKKGAKIGSKTAKVIQSTIDTIMADLDAKLAAMQGEDEEEIQE